MLSEIFAILAPIFICASIGFCWAKSGKPYDTEMITAIVTYFGTPCLVFYALATIEIAPKTIGEMAIAALLANLLLIGLGMILLRVLQLPQRAFLQSFSFPNVGNIGLPLCFLAFGEEGLGLGVAFFAVYAAFQLTAGPAFASGSISPASLLKMPVIPATLIAVAFNLSSTPVPKWLFNTSKLIGDLTIPLMLFTLGVSLARLKVQALKIPFIISLARLGAGFGVGILLVNILNLQGVAAGVVILECSMPAAVFCYLFAQQFNQRPEEVAGIVIISTLLGIGTLPALLWYVL